MSFASLEFVVFIFSFFIFWRRFSRHTTPRLWIICIFSLVFYVWGAGTGAIVLLITAAYDYWAGNWIANVEGPRRRWLLFVSVVLNIGSLLFFKSQGHFFSTNSALGFRVSDFVIPVGISFYTFQSLSYVIDIYRGKKPAESFLHFFSYLVFFPQLVAGPIERGEKFLPQLLTLSRQPPNYFSALLLVVWGYFKKLFVADHLATFVNSAYAKPPDAIGGSMWLLIGFAFFVQLYCDLSAYSDIARGIARGLGFELTINFRSPFFAIGIRDYWHRFHISISEWFRDYLFRPLSEAASHWPTQLKPLWLCFALTITMVASGLWHGLALTFVVCGIYGAIGLIVEHITKWPQFFQNKLSPFLGGIIVVALTVLFHTVGILMFRAQTFEQGLQIYRSLFVGVHDIALSNFVSTKLVNLLTWQAWLGVAVVLIWDGISAYDQFFEKFKKQILNVPWGTEISFGLLLLGLLLFYGRPTEFVYFQF
jgi:alginate O-acetyltransferase complex protein AlgI